MPSVCTPTTSVPLPPTSPAPALGGFFTASGVDFAVTLGVARGAAFVGMALFAFVGGALALVSGRGGVVVAGSVGAGASDTTPAARSPAGAATRSTLYTGGIRSGGGDFIKITPTMIAA